MSEYGTIGVFFLLTVAFPLSALGLARLLRPRPRQGKEKLKTYECGVDTLGKTWIRFRINYFLYALVFLVFDVETIFLYPWAVKFQHMGLFAFIEMLVFIAILLIGLWYAWKEGALEWY
ncbi:MAG: NADH-quinone oxidoreductase subunit A [Syntrophomonas sp.]